MERCEDALTAWVRYQHAAGLSERTITSRVATLRILARAVDPLTASSDDITDWLATLTTGRTGEPVLIGTRATYRRQLGAFYGWLSDMGHRRDNPMAHVPKVRTSLGLPRPWSPEQARSILDACLDPRAVQTRAYVILAAFAGLRVHEIAKVRGEDVRGDELAVAGKGGSDSTIPMHPMVQALARTMPQSGWWFPSDSATGHVHRCSVSSAIKRAMTRAGVPGTPHAARHHYGTQVLRASGGDLRTAQRALRHKSVQTTAIYTQVPDDALRRAIAGIPAA